jgi:Domain of unknown function (DUF4249)
MKNFKYNIHSFIQYPLRHSFTHSKLAIFLIISQLALFSCNSLVKEIDPSVLPQTDSKLVVACFISPQDTVLAAKVTETKVLIGSTGGIRDDIKDATIKLSDGTKTINLVYNVGDAYYRALPSELPIISGKTYTIAVSTPDGRKVSATTTVPLSAGIKEIKLDSAKVTDDRGTNTEYSVKLIWQDKAGIANFYRGIGVFEVNNKSNSGVITINSPIVDFRTIDDKGTDGELISLTGVYQARPQGGGGPGGGNQNQASISLRKISVALLQTDPSYYYYHASLRKQRDNNNPFAEPILLYTNVVGGFGCFGAYNATWQDVKLK